MHLATRQVPGRPTARRFCCHRSIPVGWHLCTNISNVKGYTYVYSKVCMYWMDESMRVCPWLTLWCCAKLGPTPLEKKAYNLSFCALSKRKTCKFQSHAQLFLVCLTDHILCCANDISLKSSQALKWRRDVPLWEMLIWPFNPLESWLLLLSLLWS